MNKLNTFIKQISNEDFSTILEKKLKNQPKEGTVATGTISKIHKKNIFVDVGLKTEGIIPISELNNKNIKIGDKIEVFIIKLFDYNVFFGDYLQYISWSVKNSKTLDMLTTLYLKGL